MGSETAITASITRHLDKLGIFWHKFHGSPFQRRGTPDLLVVKEGQAYFFEVKKLGQEASKLQEYRIRQIRTAGAVAVVAYGWSDVQRILRI